MWNKIFFYLEAIGILASVWYFLSPYYSIILLILYLLKQYFNGPCNKNSTVDLTNKVVIITGGLKGIGYATVIELAKLNAKIILCARMKQWREAIEQIHEIKKLTMNQKIEYFPLDLDDQKSILKFIVDIKKIHSEGVDILINNAGISAINQEKTLQGIEMEFGVNHIGHFLLTLGLLGMLHKNPQSRIINVSSKLYASADIDFDAIEEKKSTMQKFNSSRAYDNSKLANILFTEYLSLKLKSNQIKCVSLHPGVVRTNFLKKLSIKLFIYSIYPLFYLLTKSPYYGAQTTLHCCTEKFENLVSGGFYSDCQYEKIKHKQLNLQCMKKLWKQSLELCGIEENFSFVKRDEEIMEEETKKNQ